MQKLILLGLALVLTSGLYAQKDMVVRVSGGAAIPIGAFSSGAERSIGFAELGPRGSVEISYPLQKCLGLVLSVGYGVNGTNATKIASQYIKENPSFGQVEVKSGSYQYVSVLLGVESKFPLSQKLFLVGQLSPGIAHIKGPANLVKVSYSSPYEEKITAGSTNAFAYQGNFSLNYTVNQKVAVGLLMNYFETSAEFSIVDATTKTTTPVKQKVAILTPGLQLSYALR